MFPGMSPFNQLQPFAQGMGGVNPILSQLINQPAPHPLLASLLAQPGVGQGWGQPAHPLAAAYIAANYPALLPILADRAAQGQMGLPFQPFGVGQFAGGFGQQSYPIATILSLLGQQGYGPQFGGIGQQTNPLNTILSLVAQQRSQQSFGQQFGGFGQPANPLGVILSLIGQQGFGQQACLDPFTAAQQFSQWTQSQLPIRPLISPQQYDPFQASSLASAICGQTIDPYTAQSCLISPFAVSPIQQALRPPFVAPWSVSAGVSPLASCGIPQVISPMVSAGIAPLASWGIPQIIPPIAPQAASIAVPLAAPIMPSAAQPCV